MVSFENKRARYQTVTTADPTRWNMTRDVLAAQPWFARLQPVFENAVARPSTVTGADYNKVSTLFPDDESDSQRGSAC
jgi:hypothetical protein